MEEVKIYEDATWGNYGKETVNSKIYQVYHMDGAWCGDDESMWYSFNSKDKSSISIAPTYKNFEGNKYGETKHNEEIDVTVTANVTLSGLHPLATVQIDNKFYNLDILKKPVHFFMNRDHKISIKWTPELVETFRIIKLK